MVDHMLNAIRMAAGLAQCRRCLGWWWLCPCGLCGHCHPEEACKP